MARREPCDADCTVPTSPTTGCSSAISAVTTPPAGPRTDACVTLGELAHEHFDRVVSNTVLPARVARRNRRDAVVAADRLAPARSRDRRRCGRTRPTRSTPCRARRHVVVATGTASGKSLCYQLPIVEARRRRRAATPRCSCSPPRRSRRTSCARFASGWSPTVVAATYDGDTPHRRARVDPRARQRPAHQPRDAARGDPPVTRPLGDVPAAPALRRRRRAAHAARRLRQPRRARAAPAASAVRALRRRPDVLLHQRDHRQPGRARVAALRAAGRGDRRRRLAAGRAQLRGVATTAARRAHRHARPRPTSRPPMLLVAVRGRRSSDARLHPQPPGRRAGRRPRPRRCSAERARGRARGGGVPRRLPAPTSAASSRSSWPTARSAAWSPPTRSSSGSTSARSTPWCSTASPARSRRCASRSGRAGRDQPARRRGARRRRRPARPVVRAPPRRAARPPGGGGGGQPGQPVRGARRRSPARRTSCRSPMPTSAGSATCLDDAVRDLVLDDLLKPRGERMFWAGREPPAARRRAAERLVARVPARRRRRTAWWAPSTPPASFHVAHPGAIYLHQGRQYRVDRARHRASRRRPRTGRRRRRAHADPRGRPTSRSSATEQSTPVGRGEAHLGAVERGARPGRVPAPAHVDQRGVRGRAARLPAPAADDPRRAGTPCRSTCSSPPGSSRRR